MTGPKYAMSSHHGHSGKQELLDMRLIYQTLVEILAMTEVEELVKPSFHLNIFILYFIKTITMFWTINIMIGIHSHVISSNYCTRAGYIRPLSIAYPLKTYAEWTYPANARRCALLILGEQDTAKMHCNEHTRTPNGLAQNAQNQKTLSSSHFVPYGQHIAFQDAIQASCANISQKPRKQRHRAAMIIRLPHSQNK